MKRSVYCASWSTLVPEKFSRQELPTALATNIMSILDNHLAAQQHRIRYSLYRHSLVGRVIDALVLVGGADGHLAFGIEDHQVGIAAGGNRSLTGEEAEEF